VACSKPARKRANSRPISAKTFRLPRATTSLVRAKTLSTSSTRRIRSCRLTSCSTRVTVRNTPATASAISGAARNCSARLSVRSSDRMVCPACFEAQVAKVHQLAEGIPHAVSARESSW
jgi:hypothetical protein